MMTRDSMPPIAAITGASGAEIRQVLAALVAEWRGRFRVCGLLAEDHGLDGPRPCSAGYLRSIADGALYPIFQDLGVGSDACHLDGGGAVAAVEAVRRDIAAGCDLVVLSKFGRLEAEGRGLREAFAAALEAGRPVLTSVSPNFTGAWREFAAPFCIDLPAEPARIRAWWEAMALAGQEQS